VIRSNEKARQPTVSSGCFAKRCLGWRDPQDRASRAPPSRVLGSVHSAIYWLRRAQMRQRRHKYMRVVIISE
jgi:hypothetical protein